jgi:hypothetical protein
MLNPLRVTIGHFSAVTKCDDEENFAFEFRLLKWQAARVV